MAYEIPQQLQYEEKIIFGLTFRQLLYAVLFGIPSIIIFFKTRMDVYTRSTIVLILLAIASLFMFFNFSRYLRDIVQWTKFREMRQMDDKMIQFLRIEKIEKGELYVWKTKKYPKKKK